MPISIEPVSLKSLNVFANSLDHQDPKLFSSDNEIKRVRVVSFKLSSARRPHPQMNTTLGVVSLADEQLHSLL